MFKKLFIGVCSIILFTGCVGKNDLFKSNDDLPLKELKFGKKLYITVENDEIIDSDFLKNLTKGEIKKCKPFFDLWDSNELEKLIEYMEINDYRILPGKYTINQAWGFEDGMFVIKKVVDGKIEVEKREILKFQIKEH